MAVPLLSLSMTGGDGSFTTTTNRALGSYHALQATELGPGCGRMAIKGDKEFRLTFYALLLKAGLVNGFQRVQDTVVRPAPGQESTGHAQVDFLDADWNVVLSTTSDVKGTRLDVP